MVSLRGWVAVLLGVGCVCACGRKGAPVPRSYLLQQDKEVTGSGKTKEELLERKSPRATEGL